MRGYVADAVWAALGTSNASTLLADAQGGQEGQGGAQGKQGVQGGHAGATGRPHRASHERARSVWNSVLVAYKNLAEPVAGGAAAGGAAAQTRTLTLTLS